MESDSGTTISVWMDVNDTPRLPPLGENVRADVCIIGAGIAGMTTAYHLAREGKSVVVLDDGRIGGGETCRTTAHLSNALDDRYYNLERLFGEDGARLAAESHAAAIDRIERIVADEKIDCDFERLDGYLFVPPNESSDELEREYEAARRAGVSVEWADRAPMKEFDTGRCLRFLRQGQFDPLKYLAGLERAVTAAGGRIRLGTHVDEIEEGEPTRIRTSGGHVVTADAVVVATNSPISEAVVIHTKQAPYRTYVVGARVPRGSVERALYWDTLDPYHYVRLQSVGDDDVLIVGGEDHKTGHEDDGDERFAALQKWTQRHFPVAGKVEYAWSGQVMEPSDSLAFIGRTSGSGNVYVATGDSGHGMTHGTIAGMLLTDLIVGRENPWAELYDPSRLRSVATTDFATENLDVAAQYADWVTGGEVSSAEEIEAGEGAILRRGLKKIAAYRDEEGRLHEQSAVCRHAGCVVAWNSTEKSWDCPCHGSRYDARGRVLNGPALEDLAEAGGE